MKVKRKDMQNIGWFRIIDKKYISEPITFEKYNGVISLNIWNKITEPLIVNNSKYDVKILDNGYKWLQVAFENEHFWLTAMYDNCDNLIELYFDITRGNYFDDINNPYCYDLFSDVVVTKDKKILILDEDELDMAFSEGIVTSHEYDMVKRTTKELCNYLDKNKDYVIDKCYYYLKTLSNKCLTDE